MVEVTMQDGSRLKVKVVESYYSQDVGAYVKICKTPTREFMAVGRPGAWREWTSADRTAPLREKLRNA
jgi:hypothetical protein